MLSLLPRAALVATSAVDHADWNYDGLLGYVSRRRFALVRALLPAAPVARLLEVGYGSGVFLPELARHTRELHGADVHDRIAAVTASLARAAVAATLVEAPAERLPYADGSFDVVVAVSTFEFVSDPDAAIAEISRVLTPAGRAIVVTPNVHPLLDAALRIATGESAERDFAGRRELVMPALRRVMTVERALAFPPLVPIPVYRALRLAKRDRPHERAAAR